MKRLFLILLVILLVLTGVAIGQTLFDVGCPTPLIEYEIDKNGDNLDYLVRRDLKLRRDADNGDLICRYGAKQLEIIFPSER